MAWAFALGVGLVPAVMHGSATATLDVGRFSEMTPGGEISGWQPLTFARIESFTRYTLVVDGGRTVLRAQSRASASGLVKKLDLDPRDYPVLTWSWKISNILEKGDLGKRSGDDYPARIYITFSLPPDQRSLVARTRMAAIKLLYGEEPPDAALTYVWGNRAANGSIHPNPYTDRVQMVILESGPDHANQWRSVRRDIVADFRRAFGNEPPRISAVAVMTDTDNTGESATAWYGDIQFHGSP